MVAAPSHSVGGGIKIGESPALRQPTASCRAVGAAQGMGDIGGSVFFPFFFYNSTTLVWPSLEDYWCRTGDRTPTGRLVSWSLDHWTTCPSAAACFLDGTTGHSTLVCVAFFLDYPPNTPPPPTHTTFCYLWVRRMKVLYSCSLPIVIHFPFFVLISLQIPMIMGAAHGFLRPKKACSFFLPKKRKLVYFFPRGGG